MQTDDESPDVPELLKLFQKPTLEFLSVENMFYDKDITIPSDIRQCGTSNVKCLILTACAAVGKELAVMMRLPKNLHKLEIQTYKSFGCAVSDAQALKTYNYDYILRALNPQILHLQEFTLAGNIYSMSPYDVPARGEALKNFTQLCRLNIPLGLLMRFLEDGEDFFPGTPLAPSIESRLPSSLEELTLHTKWGLRWRRKLYYKELSQVDTSDPNWNGAYIVGSKSSRRCDRRGLTISQVPGFYVPSYHSERIFEWLSGLVLHRDEFFPNLRQLTVVRNTYDKMGYPFDQPLECPSYWNFVESFREKGISIKFE